MRFFLGTHHPNHLWDPAATGVDLFVSHGQLRRYKSFKRAVTSWACDSRGFTELSQHGRWTITAKEYAAALARYRDEIGELAWASPQDWMCEPFITAKTGLKVADHQRRTVDNFFELRALGAPVIPVLQGWSRGQYFDCLELYDRAGINLRAEPVVGVGSVCRRQNTMSAAWLMRDLADEGLRIHGFGFKKTGLRACHDALWSADSMAWSFHARREPPRQECRGKHKNCANCLTFALEWREELLGSLTMHARTPARQLSLLEVA